MKCIECNSCVKGFFNNRPELYACIGVKHPYIIRDVNQECVEYSYLKEKQNFDFNIPKSQKVCEIYLTNGKPKYVMTENSTKTQYTLWKVKNDRDVEKIETAKKPIFKTKL